LFLDFTPKIEKKAPRNASKKYCDFEDVFFVFLALRGRKGGQKATFLEPETGPKQSRRREKQDLGDMLHPTRLLIKIKVLASQNLGKFEKKAGRKAFGRRLCTGRRF
jgi:hypothetical protein